MAKYKFSKTFKPGEGIVILANGQIEPIPQVVETANEKVFVQNCHNSAPKRQHRDYIDLSDYDIYDDNDSSGRECRATYAENCDILDLNRKSNEIMCRLRNTKAMLQLQREVNHRYVSRRDQNWFIANLATPALCLMQVKILRLRFLGEIYGIDGSNRISRWERTLLFVLHKLAETDFRRLSTIYAMGLLKWIKTPRQYFMGDVLAGHMSFNFAKTEDACIALQWLHGMFDINLDETCFEFSVQEPRRQKFLKKGWAEVGRQGWVPEGLSRCRLCGMIVNDFQRHMMDVHNQRTSCHEIAEDRSDFMMIETATSGSGINYSPSSQAAYLVGSDGIVIGRTTSVDSERGASVVHSQTDEEDSWKGFGYMARDGGRYGSINGEDYAD